MFIKLTNVTLLHTKVETLGSNSIYNVIHSIPSISFQVFLLFPSFLSSIGSRGLGSFLTRLLISYYLSHISVRGDSACCLCWVSLRGGEGPVWCCRKLNQEVSSYVVVAFFASFWNTSIKIVSVKKGNNLVCFPALTSTIQIIAIKA